MFPKQEEQVSLDSLVEVFREGRLDLVLGHLTLPVRTLIARTHGRSHQPQHARAVASLAQHLLEVQFGGVPEILVDAHDQLHAVLVAGRVVGQLLLDIIEVEVWVDVLVQRGHRLVVDRVIHRLVVDRVVAVGRVPGLLLFLVRLEPDHRACFIM